MRFNKIDYPRLKHKDLFLTIIRVKRIINATKANNNLSMIVNVSVKLFSSHSFIRFRVKASVELFSLTLKFVHSGLLIIETFTLVPFKHPSVELNNTIFELF